MDSFILIYVDDLLVFAITTRERDEIVDELKELYELRVSEEVDMFLGVQMDWNSNISGASESLKMSQPLYTETILRRFGLQDSKPALTPMVESFYTGLVAESDKSVVSGKTYQKMIGSPLYLALRTRFYILASLLILVRFQNAPTAYCHRAIKRLLIYVRGTSKYGIIYNSGSIELNSFVDANHAGNTIDRKSMSGYIVKLGDAACISGAKKQDAVALSTCESEYYALVLAAKETIWISRVLNEVGLGTARAVKLRSDNKAAIKWATGERCP